MSQCLIIDSPSLLEEKGWVNGAVISGGCFKSSGLWPRFRDPPSVPAILSFKCTQCIYCYHLQSYFSSVLHRRLWIVMEWLESWGGTLDNANGNAHVDNNTRFQQSQNVIPVTSMMVAAPYHGFISHSWKDWRYFDTFWVSVPLLVFNYDEHIRCLIWFWHVQVWNEFNWYLNHFENCLIEVWKVMETRPVFPLNESRFSNMRQHSLMQAAGIPGNIWICVQHIGV